MKCSYCENEMEQTDPAYEMGMHATCFSELQKEMVKHGYIFISPTCPMQFSFTKRFNKHFNRTMNHTRLHITCDNTVSEDIVDLQGVLRAVTGFVSKGEITEKQIYLFSMIIFNGLMIQKYGSPLSLEKHFASRIKEFATEVHSIETSEKESQLFRRVIKKGLPEVNTERIPAGTVATSALDENLDKTLDDTTAEILTIIDKIALKMETEMGASKKWRNFRKDELVLQTIETILIKHLENAPLPDLNISQSDSNVYLNSVKSLLTDSAIRANVIAKRDNLPVDVVFTRSVNNSIVNIINSFIELKSQYRSNA